MQNRYLDKKHNKHDIGEVHTYFKQKNSRIYIFVCAYK